MKISLTTIFDNPNFGTYLQALALALVLQKYGASVEILHYERESWHPISSFRKKTRYMDWLRKIKRRLSCNPFVKQKEACRKFVAKYITVSKEYCGYNDLLKNPPKADVYLTGSDQVWNTTHNKGLDRAFYLDFAPSNAPKYSYAASIGMDCIPEEYKRETVKLLKRYNQISVREKSAVDLLKKIGIEAEEVLDPTFLLTKDDWSCYSCKRLIEKPYLLVYSVEYTDQDKLVSKVARKIAQEKHLQIVEINYAGPNKSIPGCDEHLFFATPDMFLSAIKYASFVVVSSFHGTAFSINFNKNFLSITPKQFSSRLDDLLTETNLLSRKISSLEDLANINVNQDICFDQAEAVIAKKKKNSLKFIEQMFT